jgi:hypothetical protein
VQQTQAHASQVQSPPKQQSQPSAQAQPQLPAQSGQTLQQPLARLVGREASAQAFAAPGTATVTGSEQQEYVSAAEELATPPQQMQTQPLQTQSPPAQHPQPPSQSHAQPSPHSGQAAQHEPAAADVLAGAAADRTIPAAESDANDTNRISLDMESLHWKSRTGFGGAAQRRRQFHRRK